MLLHLTAGLGLGALIGVERRWRARMAGLLTNAPVTTGATLFALLSAYGFGTACTTASGWPTPPGGRDL